MSLTKETKIGQIEIVADWSIQVRTDTILKENGTEISRSYHRHVLQPFISSYKTKEQDGEIVPDLKDGKLQWTHTATDISKEDEKVQAICKAAWTTSVKTACKKYNESRGEIRE
tara:strand:- start:327 stop:668 length:342 start_codon:yes stop_codon:yes gene_type:complete